MNKRTILLLLLFSVALAFYSQNAFADGSYACSYSGDCSDDGTSPFSGSGCYPSDLTGTYTAVCKLGVTYSCSYCSNGCSSGVCNPAPAPTPTPTCTPSCSGEQCGQSNGCGGTCPSTDASTPGKCGNPAPDPCATVTCSTPPSPTCSGTNLITYGQGKCTNGACTYTPTLQQNCPYGCENNACKPAPTPTPTPTDPCATVTCSTPPSPTCSGTNLITYGQGRCIDGACRFPSVSLNCPYGCTAGACNPGRTQQCGGENQDCCIGNLCNFGLKCQETKVGYTVIAAVCKKPVQQTTPSCIDNDGDGYGQNCAKGNDCNDNNAGVNPGVTEPNCDADTVDNDCKFGDAPACAILISARSNVCGDGKVTGSEQCEPGVSSGSQTCGDYGTISYGCTSSCTWEQATCPRCGDGTCNGPETPSTCPSDCKEFKTDLMVTGLKYSTSYPNVAIPRVIKNVGQVDFGIEIANIGGKASSYGYMYACGNGMGGGGAVSEGVEIAPKESVTIADVACIYEQSGHFVINANVIPKDDANQDNNGIKTDIYIVNPDENNVIKKSDYFVLGNSYLMQYVGADAITASSIFPTAKFKNVATNEILQVAAGSVAGSIKIGGATYIFTSKSEPKYADYDIIVDLNGDGKLGKIGEAEKVASCTDSDGGVNVYVAGEAENATASTFDYCDFLTGSTNVLMDAVCEGTRVSHAPMTCPSEAPYCNKAVCSTTPPKCEETDKGNDIYNKGTVTEARIANGPKNTDYCEDLNTKMAVEQCEGDSCGLREFYCASLNNMAYPDVKCPNGCKDGACLPYSSPTVRIYSGANFECYDGTGGGFRISDNAPCMNIDELNSEANKNCAGKCKTGTDGVTKCGVNSLSTRQCEQAQTSPKDVTLVCPSRIDFTFGKDTYRVGDNYLVSIMTYDEKGKPVGADLIVEVTKDGFTDKSTTTTKPSGAYTESGVFKESEIGKWVFTLTQSDECAAIGRYISATASVTVPPSEPKEVASSQKAQADESLEIVKVISGAKQAPPAPPSPPGIAIRTEPAAQGGVGDVFAGVGSLIKGLLGFIYS